MARDSLHESIVVGLLTKAWASVLADPNVPFNDRLVALAQRLPIVEEGAKTLRLMVDDLMVSTAPETTRARAAAADTARKAAAAIEKAATDRITRQVKLTNAEAALADARRDLAEATHEADRAEKSEAPARDRLLLKGAMREAADHLAEVESELAKLAKAAP